MLRGLLVRPALQVAEDQRRTILGRQPAQFLVQHLSPLEITRGVDSRDGWEFQGDRLVSAAASRSSSSPQGHPHGHAIQPGTDRIPRTELAGPAHQHQERRLERVLDVTLILEHAPADTQHHRPVPGDQRLERRLITPLQVALE